MNALYLKEYTLTDIKKIIVNERKYLMRIVISESNSAKWHREFFNELIYNFEKMVNECENFDALNDIVLEYYKMSLNEWFDSLKVNTCVDTIGIGE